LALKYREVLENLRLKTGKSLETIHIVGGGTQNELLNQMTADSTGCEVIAGPIEATSAGNLITQMIANRELSSLEQGRELVAESFELKKYQPNCSASWDEAYDKMQGIRKSET